MALGSPPLGDAMFACVGRTDVDWVTLLQAARGELGRSVTVSLDDAKLPTNCLASFLCVVSEISRPGEAMKQLRQDALVRRHVHFSFFIRIPRDRHMTLAGHGIAVTQAEHGDNAIVSATLATWVHAVVDGTNGPLREFFCKLMGWFERENFGEAWSNFEKVHHPDGFYALVPK